MNKQTKKWHLGRLIGARQHKDPLKRRPRPFRDWHLMLIVWLMLVIVLALLHYWLFNDVNKARRLSPDAGQEHLPELDPNQLHQVAEYWRQRSQTAPTP